MLCRAAFLVKGAKHVADNLDGQLPQTAAELTTIPGIGPYTSAAIASIAFGEQVAAVDGNVMRVMARLCTIPGTTKERAFTAAVAGASQALLAKQRPGDFNQAVMELGAGVPHCTVLTPRCLHNCRQNCMQQGLNWNCSAASKLACLVAMLLRPRHDGEITTTHAGATVCKPQPSCAACPLATVCKAHQNAQASGGPPVTDYPGRLAPIVKKLTNAAACVLVLHSGQDTDHCSVLSQPQVHDATAELLLVQRPSKGLLAGMWEVPTADMEEGGDDAQALLGKVIARISCNGEAAEACGQAVQSAAQCGSFVHQFSHISLTTVVHRADIQLSSAAHEQLRQHCAGLQGVKLAAWSDAKAAGASTLTMKVLQTAQSTEPSVKGNANTMLKYVKKQSRQ